MSAVTGIISCFVNAAPNVKLVGYSYREQIADILPSMVASLIMLGGVLAVGMLPLNDILTLIVQVFTGVTIYLALSVLLGLKPFKQMLGLLRKPSGKK